MDFGDRESQFYLKFTKVFLRCKWVFVIESPNLLNIYKGFSSMEVGFVIKKSKLLKIFEGFRPTQSNFAPPSILFPKKEFALVSKSRMLVQLLPSSMKVSKNLVQLPFGLKVQYLL